MIQTANCLSFLQAATMAVWICCVSVSSLCAQSGGNPSGHPDYKVESIEAMDDDTSHGERKSTETLKMVKRESDRSASLKAKTSGIKEDGEPIWSGWENASDYDAETEASWTGASSTTVTASASEGQASVRIELFDPFTRKLDITWEKAGGKDVERQINDYLTQYKKKPSWSGEGAIFISNERVDYYGDGGKIGSKVGVGGEVSFGFEEIKVPFLPIPVAAGVEVTPSAKIDKLTGNIKVEFAYDESLSDPWKDPVSATFSGSAGIALGGEITAGATNVVEAYVNANVKTSLSVSGTISTQGKKIVLKKLSAKAGVLKGELEAGIYFFGATKFEIYTIKGQWPSEESSSLDWEAPSETELYVIPEPL